MPEKCTPAGGGGFLSNPSDSEFASSAASGNTTATEASAAMAESYAIAASRSGALAVVQAIKATRAPVPELKRKVTALAEWAESTSKHHSAKGTTLGKVVAAMAKLFDWPADEIADTAWEQAEEDPMMFMIQDVGLLEKAKGGLSNGLCGMIEDSDPDTGMQAVAHLIKVVVQLVDYSECVVSSPGNSLLCGIPLIFSAAHGTQPTAKRRRIRRETGTTLREWGQRWWQQKDGWRCRGSWIRPAATTEHDAPGPRGAG